MFCKNCGSELKTDEILCPKCGKRVLIEETPENIAVTEETEVATEAPVTEELPLKENTLEFSNDANQAPKQQMNAEAEKPKKKRKWIKWTVIGIIVAAMAAFTVFAFPYIKNIFFRTILSEEDYFKHVVKENITEYADSISQAYVDGMVMYASGLTMHEDWQIEVGDKTKQLVRDYGNVDIGWLNSVELSGVSGFTDKEGYVDADIRLNGTNVTGLEMVMNDEEMLISLTDLNEQAIRLKTDVPMFTIINELYRIAPDAKVLKELIVRYTMCLVDGVKQVKEDSDVIKAGDVQKKYLKMTAQIDEKVAVDGLKKVLIEAKNDPEIKKIIKDFCGTTVVNRNPDEVYADFQTGIDELLGDINRANISFKFDFVIWVDLKGDIVGMGIETDEFQASYANALKGRKLGTRVNVKMGQFTASFEGHGEMKSDKFNGNYSLTVNTIPIVDVKVQNVDYKLIKRNIFNGQVSIAPSSMAKGLLSASGNELLSLVSGGKIVLDFEATKRFENKMGLTIYSNDEMLISLKTNADRTTANVPTISNCVDVDDYVEMVTWSSKTLGNLAFNLSKAGVPYSILLNLKN